ncbi:autotransporter domain-containing protein [Bradyrhizobium guangdongense]
MTFRIGLPVVAAGILGCASMWPGVAAAQCTAAAPDQTCTNSGSITGPLQAQGLVGSDGGPGAPGGAGGNASTINTGTISLFGASATAGAGGLGGDGWTGGIGGNGGSAALSNTGGIAGAVTVMAGRGGDGGYGGAGFGQGADGGHGGGAVLINSGSIGGIVTVTAGGGGGGNDPSSASNNGAGGSGGVGGSAALTNIGSIGGAALVTGGVGGYGGNSDTDSGGAGSNGGAASLTNSGTIAAGATVKGGAGGGGGEGYRGGSGSGGGDAMLTNTGSIGGAAVAWGGSGGRGAVGDSDDGGWGGSGGNAALVNAGHIGGSATVTGGAGGNAADYSFNDSGSGGSGGDATLTNTGKIAAAATVTGGKGGSGGSGGGNSGDGGNGGNATLSNWGGIFGAVTVAGGMHGTAGNGGVDGTDGTATLNVYAGSRIAGAITLTGSAKYLNFFGGNYSYTLNSLSGVNISVAGAPFVVLGNTVVVVDPQVSASVLSTNVRALVDFSRTASDAVPVFSGNAPGSGGAPLAFAGSEAPSRFDDAFAAVSGLSSAYAGDAVVFKAPTATYADGTSVWARGFAGQRVQQQDGAQLRNTNLFYGGMMGADFAFRPDLRFGIYLGGGDTKSAIDLNQGSSNADLVFGGAYARYDIGQSFLHAAVQAGGSRNNVSRTVNNNLALNGIETASASFNGWYVSPEATLGHRWALGNLGGAAYTLMPSLRLRYLYGAYDGYAETGTAAPLTVGSQSVSALEERGEMKLTRSVSFTASDMLSASISAGLLGTQRMGGNTVNAALLGQAIPFATTGQADIWGGFGGLGLEWRSRNVTLFSAAEYLALSDKSNVVSGRAGLRVAF